MRPEATLQRNKKGTWRKDLQQAHMIVAKSALNPHSWRDYNEMQEEAFARSNP